VTFAPNSGAALDRVRGLVLTGGTDVDPALYNAVRIPESNVPDRERDDYESNLLRAAIERDMPILAICRGSQLFNVVCRGTLIQHLLNSEKHKQRTGGVPVHDVVLEDRMASVFGATRMAVNSRHHQAVDRLGGGLIATARSADDGIIEGFVLPTARFAWAVQWHPEEMADDERQARLFRAFADSAMSG
jgi:gamma-glutamyl-gamma-aminobutyrate hydrolase PuuD